MPFTVITAQTKKGRRQSIHEYPYVDGGWPEDMGSALRICSFSGCLIGDLAPVRQRVLDNAVEAKGPGLLIHPTIGTVKVAVGSASTAIHRDKMRVIEVALAFIKAGSPVFPATIIATAVAVFAAADSAWTAACSDLGRTAIPAAAGDAGGNATYIVLKALRSAVVQDLTMRSACQPSVPTVNLPLPPLAIAHRLHLDASRSDRIAAEADAERRGVSTPLSERAAEPDHEPSLLDSTGPAGLDPARIFHRKVVCRMATSKSNSRQKTSAWVENIKTIVYAGLIALVVRTVAYEPFNIPSGSMIPTLQVGDYLFVAKYSYGYSHFSLPLSPDLFSGRIFGSLPARGDVIVFRYPKDTSIDYIKRVVGLPGDTVQVRDGELYIDGKEVPRKSVGDYTTDDQGFPLVQREYLETLPGSDHHAPVTHDILKETDQGFANNTPVYTVPPNHLFVMGDNRDNSADSRFWGFVPMVNVVGKAEIIFFSFNSKDPWWEFWEWPFEIRWNRLFMLIH